MLLYDARQFLPTPFISLWIISLLSQDLLFSLYIAFLFSRYISSFLYLQISKLLFHFSIYFFHHIIWHLVKTQQKKNIFVKRRSWEKKKYLTFVRREGGTLYFFRTFLMLIQLNEKRKYAEEEKLNKWNKIFQVEDFLAKIWNLEFIKDKRPIRPCFFSSYAFFLLSSLPSPSSWAQTAIAASTSPYGGN